MPNLPGDSLDGEMVKLMDGLLRYPPERRTSALDALQYRLLDDVEMDIDRASEPMLRLLQTLDGVQI
jgi:hypothetical protein